MEVFTLSGASGTGKSYQAMDLCRKYDLDSIVDDGLYIYRNRVLAGMSAKRQKTKYGAIKTALFINDEQREAVKYAIAESKPNSILIIGTSDKMVERIREALGLPDITRRFHIEDITTEDERRIAERQRQYQGKHVIPVPAPQLKRAFAGYFINPLKMLMPVGGKNPGERTVVRPTFSYMGDFYVSDIVIDDIARCVANETHGISKVTKIYENTSPDNLRLAVSVIVERGVKVWQIAMNFQKNLADQIESMTAFNVVHVDVEVKDIDRSHAYVQDNQS